jgi:hypothetical protein
LVLGGISQSGHSNGFESQYGANVTRYVDVIV